MDSVCVGGAGRVYHTGYLGIQGESKGCLFSFFSLTVMPVDQLTDEQMNAQAGKFFLFHFLARLLFALPISYISSYMTRTIVGAGTLEYAVVTI